MWRKQHGSKAILVDLKKVKERKKESRWISKTGKLLLREIDERIIMWTGAELFYPDHCAVMGVAWPHLILCRYMYLI
jgi:hypothetical protein